MRRKRERERARVKKGATIQGDRPPREDLWLERNGWFLWLKLWLKIVDYEDIMAGNGCFGLGGLDMTGIA